MYVIISGHNSDLIYLQVVVLIDEYDTPMNKAKTAARDELQDLYIAFFTVLRSKRASIRMTYVTGATLVGLSDMYGGASHLADLTDDPAYRTLSWAIEENI